MRISPVTVEYEFKFDARALREESKLRARTIPRILNKETCAGNTFGWNRKDSSKCNDPECLIIYGYCHCGCGNPTALASQFLNTRTRIAQRHQPNMYCLGHAPKETKERTLELLYKGRAYWHSQPKTKEWLKNLKPFLGFRL